MGKSKKGKKKKHEANWKKKTEIKTNPFEMRINHEKHNVLNRKMKHEMGLPGIARNKAVKKRKETLLREYLNKNKSNCFIDRRIGEYASDMSKNDRITARLTQERKKDQFVYKLNEDEKLTHLGKPVLELDAHDDPRSESDEELDPEFIKEAHFGGFLTKKKTEIHSAHKSHKDYMNELIADTKHKKHEKQVEKEATTVLTEKLDEEWKTVQSLLPKLKKDDTKPQDQNKPDQYDFTVRQLQFEARGKAVDRMKSPEEIAKTEKEKLENLEAERLRRMTGTTQAKLNSSNHLSADDLYDGLQLDVNEGTMNSVAEISEKQVNRNEYIEKESSDSAEEAAAEESEDSYSDLQSDEESANKASVEKNTPSKNIHIKQQISECKNNSSTLSFVHDVPLDFEQFLNLVSECGYEEQGIIIDGMIKCNHPSIGDGNRSKMEKLFVFILQYIHDICEDLSMSLTPINILAPYLYTLSQLSPLKTAESFREVILEKFEEFHMWEKQKAGLVDCPGLSTLIFFKLCCILYPTSDFSHPVVTPSMLFMSQILTHCNFNTIHNILKGLFICNLFLEYISYSRRFIPEAINFLTRVMCLSGCKDHKQSINPVLSGNVDLVVRGNTDCELASFHLNCLRTASHENGDEIKMLIIKSNICLLYDFAVIYENLPSWTEIFSPIKPLCSDVLKKHPQKLASCIEKLEKLLDKDIPFKYLMQERRRPQSLKLFEPRFKEKFDGKKRLTGSKEKIKQTLLVRKYKKELKGAVREIRQDNYFLAGEILTEKMERDAERKRKVKELYRDLAVQESEFKALKKKK